MTTGDQPILEPPFDGMGIRIRAMAPWSALVQVMTSTSAPLLLGGGLGEGGESSLQRRELVGRPNLRAFCREGLQSLEQVGRGGRVQNGGRNLFRRVRADINVLALFVETDA